jgi:hypothetical protein
MINSFIELVNESNTPTGLVDEMGIKRVERLSGSDMGAMRQASLDLRNRQPVKPKIFEEVAGELILKLRQINRSSIIVEPISNTRNYYIKFPTDIVELMQSLKSINESKFVDLFGKWRDVYPTYSDAIKFKIDPVESFQRSHFPGGGIPPSLRGIGLGYKMYRQLLKTVEYISSNTSGSTEKDKAWGSLLSFKGTNGIPNEDDAHAIIGANNWLAMDKAVPTAKKIKVAESFIASLGGTSSTSPTKFDIDDELLEILPNTVLVKLNRDYIRSLVTDSRISSEKAEQIESTRDEADRLAQERQARADQEAQQRRAREEVSVRERLADRIRQYGADPDADWDIGDFIVVKTYLYDASYSGLPIRRVVARNNTEYRAAKISDAIRIDNGEITPTAANDSRTTTRKSAWVKVNINQIPDLTRVNLSTAEIRYVEALLNPELVAARQAEVEAATARRLETERTQNAERSQSLATFGTFPPTGAELKRDMANRSAIRNFELVKKFKSQDFTRNLQFIVLGPAQRDMFRNNWGIPVFIPWKGSQYNPRPISSLAELTESNAQNITLTNPVNGVTINYPYVGLGLTGYQLSEVTMDDKLSARSGQHYYIAGHQNAFGIIAKSEYGARNTSDQKFIYVKAYGWGDRSVSVRLDLLRKIGEPIQI